MGGTFPVGSVANFHLLYVPMHVGARDITTLAGKMKGNVVVVV